MDELTHYIVYYVIQSHSRCGVYNYYDHDTVDADNRDAAVAKVRELRDHHNNGQWKFRVMRVEELNHIEKKGGMPE